jgi:hypothetical protein
MYHVELRQFPHNFCRFNLTEQQLRETILDAWAQGEWIELGERKWNPHQAKLTVLEGPQVPLEQLSMGRGWRNAGREGRDVTEQLLASSRDSPSAPSEMYRKDAQAAPSQGDQSGGGKPGEGVGQARSADPALELRLASDSLGLELLARLTDAPVMPSIAWALARERYPERSASGCLKLAEHAIRSLAESGLVVVLAAGAGAEPEPCKSQEQVEQALLLIECWSGAKSSASTLIRRA